MSSSSCRWRRRRAGRQVVVLDMRVLMRCGLHCFSLVQYGGSVCECNMYTDMERMIVDLRIVQHVVKEMVLRHSAVSVHAP